MNIWTLKEGEPLPLPECIGRKMRCGILSEFLANRGNNVIWWTSDYLHQTKRRLSVTGDVKINDNLKMKMLHSNITYKKNISIERFLYSIKIGKEFEKLSREVEKPDIIYCSFPLVDFAYEATRYAIEKNIPIVVDVRDLWPDIIYDRLPRTIRWIGPKIFYGLEKKTNYIFQNATRLTATVPFDLEWAQKRADRADISYDKVFLMGYETALVNMQERNRINDALSKIRVCDQDFIICYFGNITDTIIDINAIITAANELKAYKEIKFVICGGGVSLDAFRKRTENISNIIFPGYVSQDYITVLMEKSKIGILPYYDRWDFTDAVPNKAIEYLAGSLPVLSELTGYYGKMIEENCCGKIYKNGQTLAEYIRFYYENQQEHKIAVEHAKSLYREKFTRDRIYNEFCLYLENLAR